jgi:[protein-PII] uridylyltransferase
MSQLASRFRHVFFRIQNPLQRLEALKVVLEDERSRIRREFEAGATASASSAALSDLVDALLRSHLEARMNTVPAAWDIALVAVGGYGRREMCPKSDVDLLILTHPKASAAVSAEIEQMLYPLWDLGFVLGQAVRSVNDCRKASESDVETYTAFLQERFLGGNFELYREFANFVGERPNRRRLDNLVRMKLAERDKRLATQGKLAQMLEPNLKEGRGCLRDLHSLVWLAGIQHGARGLDDLVRHGIASPEELEELRAANEFLLRARIALHHVSGQKSDRLGFAEQIDVAKALGYHDNDRQKGVELFQKDFYRHVRTVDSVTSQYCDQIVFAEQKKTKSKSVDPRFVVVNGALEMQFSGANPFLANLPLVMDFYRCAQRTLVSVGARTRWYIRQAVSVMSTAEIDIPKCLDLLLAIARDSSERGFTLRELHRLGVIDLIVPDFRVIDCHSQHDIYHVYTTDEHTLTVLTRLSTLSRSQDPVLSHLRKEMAEVTDIDVLFLGALFHDVGKGVGPDHSDSGAKMVRAYCQLAGFSEARASQAADLVQHHLLLNHMAQRRDVEDPKTIRDLLAKVSDEHLLRKLYILTWADVSSVHPDAWSAWKASLLRRLYETSMTELTDASETPMDSQMRREALAQEAFGHPREEILEHLKRLPRRYASSVSARQVADHIELLQSLSARRRIAVKARDHGSHWDLAVVMPDRPGLLSRICAGLSTLHLSIASSQVYTRVDGVVIDLFSVIPMDHDGFRTAEEIEAKCVAQIGKARDLGADELKKMVDGYIQRWSGSVSRIMTPQARVEFHDHASDDYTVLDISGPDRLGLLFDLTSQLSKRQWVIHSARVCTEADKAIDSFSLTTSEGRRIPDDALRNEAREEIENLLRR